MDGVTVQDPPRDAEIDVTDLSSEDDIPGESIVLNLMRDSEDHFGDVGHTVRLNESDAERVRNRLDEILQNRTDD